MKDKVCLICHTAIDTDKEFCEFKHYKKKNEIRSKGWYHVNCFRGRLNNSKEQSDALKSALDTLNQVKSKFGLIEEEVVQI